MSNDIRSDQQLNIRPEGVEQANIDTGLHPFGAYEFSRPGASTSFINVLDPWEFQVAGTIIGGSTVSPTGAVVMFCRATAPTGWLNCDGSAVSRTTYSALYAITSTAFGAGDSSTSFNVPDARGIFVRGAGSHGTLTDAASSPFDGGDIGDTQNDAFQGHIFYGGIAKDNVSPFVYGGTTDELPGDATVIMSGESGSETYQQLTSNPKTDGLNGTPRTASETRPVNIALNYIIKT